MGIDVYGRISERLRKFLEKHGISFHYEELYNRDNPPSKKYGRVRIYNYLQGSPSLRLLYVKPDKVATLAGRIFTQLLRSTPFRSAHGGNARALAGIVDNYLKIHGLNDEERKRVWNILEEATKDV